MIKKIILLIIFTFCFTKDYIAVIDFDANNVKKSNARALTERLTTELIKVDQYIVVERSKVDKMLKEQKFQSSGCVNISCAVEVGNVLGAKYIVVGTISKFGQTYTLDARLVDVESSESIRSADYTSQGRIDDLLLKGVPSIVKQLVGEYDDTPQSQVEDTEDSKNRINWKLNNFLHHIRVGLDISPEYNFEGLGDDAWTYYPSSGMFVGYEYAQPNGFGVGFEYQFARNLGSDTDICCGMGSDFGYNSFYILYNFTMPDTGLKISFKLGSNDLLIYEEGVEVNGYIDYNKTFGDYSSITLSYPLSDLMQLEIGASSHAVISQYVANPIEYLENGSTDINHLYTQSHIGVTFILQ